MLWEGVRALIERTKQGDRDAMTHLYALAQPYLLALAQKLLGPDWPNKSVSDLTQETWVRAWQSIQDFHGAENEADTGALFRAWLGRTMKNLRHNDVRFDNARCRKPPPGTVPLATGTAEDSTRVGYDPPAPDPTPSQNLYRKEQLARLDAAIQRLDDPIDADVVRLRFFDGLSFAAISKRVGRDESTIRYRLQRILEFLGDELQEWQ